MIGHEKQEFSKSHLTGSEVYEPGAPNPLTKDDEVLVDERPAILLIVCNVISKSPAAAMPSI
jgi:hypothetical protein